MLHVVNTVQTQQKLIAMTSARPCAFKFNPQTAAFGKVNSLHAMSCAKVFVYCNKQTINFNVHYSHFGAYYSQSIHSVPIILWE